MNSRLIVHLVGHLVAMTRAGLRPWDRPKQPTPRATCQWHSTEDLPQVLLDTMGKLESGAFAGRDTTLEVQLGQDHARVGLLPLDESVQTHLGAVTGEALIHAWVRQCMRLDPTSQIVRWTVLPRRNHALVTCVPVTVMRALESFSMQAQLRFTSCKPAILKLLNAYDQEGGRHDRVGALTIVCTEGIEITQRSSTVQLLRLQGRSLVSAWRGWVPPTHSGDSDIALHGALRRFQLAAQGQANETAVQWHWPTWPAPSASGRMD